MVNELEIQRDAAVRAFRTLQPRASERKLLEQARELFPDKNIVKWPDGMWYRAGEDPLYPDASLDNGVTWLRSEISYEQWEQRGRLVAGVIGLKTGTGKHYGNHMRELLATGQERARR